MTKNDARLPTGHAGGEIIDITCPVRPIARPETIPEMSPLERLRSAGEVWKGVGSSEYLPEPLQPTPGIELPSRILDGLRADER